MRRIFKAINQNETVQAWIGGSAPIPEGWHLDPDSAKSAFNPSKGEESHAVRQEETEGPEEVTTDDAVVAENATTPKRRGRPRKVF